MNRHVLAPLALIVVLAACSAGPGTTTRPSGSAAPGPSGPAAPESGPAEPGVIKGRVTDQQGDPVDGAQLRLTGHTVDFNGSDEDLVTDESGTYRVEVQDGLWEVFGTASLTFEGAEYVMNLRPADGDCEPQLSAPGIVKDFVLPLSGLAMCFDYVDPDNAGSYSGGSVYLLYGQPRALPGDTQMEFTLEPVGALADGSTGTSITFERAATAMETTFGPLDETSVLHDLPLARYRISGTATLPDGSRQVLRFAAEPGASPAESAEFGFEPYLMAPYGIRSRNVTVVDESWVPGG